MRYPRSRKKRGRGVIREEGVEEGSDSPTPSTSANAARQLAALGQSRGELKLVIPRCDDMVPAAKGADGPEKVKKKAIGDDMVPPPKGAGGPEKVKKKAVGDDMVPAPKGAGGPEKVKKKAVGDDMVPAPKGAGGPEKVKKKATADKGVNVKLVEAAREKGQCKSQKAGEESSSAVDKKKTAHKNEHGLSNDALNKLSTLKKDLQICLTRLENTEDWEKMVKGSSDKKKESKEGRDGDDSDKSGDDVLSDDQALNDESEGDTGDDSVKAGDDEDKVDQSIGDKARQIVPSGPPRNVEEALAIVEDWVMPNMSFHQQLAQDNLSVALSDNVSAPAAPGEEWVMCNQAFHHANWVKSNQASYDGNWVMPNQAFHRANMMEMRAALGKEEAEEPQPDYAWMVGILWDPDILAKLEDHWNKYNSKKYSKLLIAEMLSKEVIEENPRMNFQEPYMLLQLVGDNCEWHNDEYVISVAEMSTADNGHIPVKDRMYDLVLPDCCDHFCLAEEITRLSNVPTILLIWNFELDLFEKPLLTQRNAEDKILGYIYLKQPKVDCIPAILIFHGELLDIDRMQDIQGYFYESELSHFDQTGYDIERYTRSKRITKTDSRFVVHLSRPYCLLYKDCPAVEIEWNCPSSESEKDAVVTVNIIDREEEKDDKGSDREEEKNDKRSDREEEKNDIESHREKKNDKGCDRDEKKDDKRDEEERDDKTDEEEKENKGDKDKKDDERDEEENHDERVEVVITDDENHNHEVIPGSAASSSVDGSVLIIDEDAASADAGHSSDDDASVFEKSLEAVQLETQPQCKEPGVISAVLQQSGENDNLSGVSSESQLAMLYTQELEPDGTQDENFEEAVAMELDEEEDDPMRYNFTPLIEQL